MSDLLLNLPLRNLLKALIATIIIEEFVALFWQERSFRLVAVVFAANVATNPILNAVLFALSDWISFDADRATAAVWIGELAVWSAETVVFWRWTRFSLYRAALFSFTLNSASYFAGGPLKALGFWDW